MNWKVQHINHLLGIYVMAKRNLQQQKNGWIFISDNIEAKNGRHLILIHLQIKFVIETTADFFGLAMLVKSTWIRWTRFKLVKNIMKVCLIEHGKVT